MTSPPATTLLITGANRGIGRSLTTTYLLHPSHTIIALVRDPQNETSASLFSEPRGKNTTIILLEYDASLPTSADSALTALKTQHPNITHLDTVIANAGFSSHFGPSLDADAETYIRHYTVNTLGPLFLFRAVLPLLMASTTNTNTSTSASTTSTDPTTIPRKPKFIAISSGTGSITRILSLPPSKPDSRTGALPYTSSKCALNHVMAKLNREYPEISVGLFTPGPTKTGFGGGGVDLNGIKGVTGVETVVEGLVELFDGVGEEEDEEEKFALRDWRGVELEW